MNDANAVVHCVLALGQNIQSHKFEGISLSYLSLQRKQPGPKQLETMTVTV